MQVHSFLLTLFGTFSQTQVLACKSSLRVCLCLIFHNIRHTMSRRSDGFRSASQINFVIFLPYNFDFITDCAALQTISQTTSDVIGETDFITGVFSPCLALVCKVRPPFDLQIFEQRPHGKVLVTIHSLTPWVTHSSHSTISLISSNK